MDRNLCYIEDYREVSVQEITLIDLENQELYAKCDFEFSYPVSDYSLHLTPVTHSSRLLTSFSLQ